ncbi:hypothetical protein [Streptomyces vinaceus]|uniref:hypothetical protein n=1 Tax=Streptomyces vinaceus TaxID=1960 RepID=UPI00382061DA
MISENTKEGVAAAEAAGKTLGRPVALAEKAMAKVVEAYGRGAAIKALARQHQASADPGDQQPASAPNPAVVLDLPGLLADHLRAAGDETVREALASCRTIRRGQGHSVRLAAPLELHRAALQQSAALASDTAGQPEGKAHRTYATGITAAEKP